jgi:hypothetical protein
MKAEHILEEFIKFAQFNNTISGAAPTNVIQPPIISGQPPKRTSNIPIEDSGDKNGNSVTVKPSTNPNKIKL